MLVKSWGQGFRLTILILGLWLALDLVSWVVAESLWFQEVGYSQVFWLLLKTRGWLWAIALLFTAGILSGNLALAERFQHPKQERGKLKSNYPLPNTNSPALDLNWLLPIGLGLGLLIGLILLHYGQVAASYWHLDVGQFFKFTNVPPRFQPEAIWQMVAQLSSQPWQLGAIVGFAIALLVVPKLLWAIAILMSLGFGLILSNNWAEVLLFFHATPFNSIEPVFTRDLSFYAFTLPVWELLEFWSIGVFLYAFASVCLVYLLSGNSLSEGRFPGFSGTQQRHLHALGCPLILSLALSYWLRRYELVYSIRGVAYGASYTDINVELPVYTGLSLLAVAIATFLFWRAIFWPTRKAEATPGDLSKSSQGDYAYQLPLIYTLFGYLAMAVVAGWLLSSAVQRTIVQPNELVREQPYIERSIAFTRAAFDLEHIEVKTFDPQDKLTAAAIANNSQTIRNIRLWDTRPLLATNRQLQQIRLYYKFPNADIDRYTLKQEGGKSPAPIRNSQSLTEKQQVILAARELDYNQVPVEAQTWINKHLVYTHGYGFTMSPVNTVGPGGLPDYFIKDIGVGSQNLRTTSDRIRASIPIGQPRIYYGEISDTYVMAPTRVKELDYPSDEKNVYNTYDGAGGVTIGNGVKKLLFANYLRDWQMMLTPEYTPKTKVLMRRNIRSRVEAIAPFLRYDNDPYLVVAKANINIANAQKAPTEENYLYWIFDGYTTSDRYPYSDPGQEKFNYIRNSVKVVIDAYNGHVNFYIADSSDPIIKSWNAIFPNLLKPLSEMPASLRSHIRYPTDLFNIQSERLLTYHMTDPQVFYNRDDQWRVPNEIYGSEAQQVQPYYLIMKLPTAAVEEFILLLPLTPASRNNLIAWLAGRSDGTNYGKLLLYQFPRQQLIYGPEQIEARINQDPVISQQISLWNRQGSRAFQGNLLVIPIEESLLYVEPLYLEAAQTGLPTLVRVIVAYQNSIAMAETLDGALEAIFRREKASTPALLSPGDQAAPPILTPLAP